LPRALSTSFFMYHENCWSLLNVVRARQVAGDLRCVRSHKLSIGICQSSTRLTTVAQASCAPFVWDEKPRRNFIRSREYAGFVNRATIHGPSLLDAGTSDRWLLPNHWLVNRRCAASLEPCFPLDKMHEADIDFKTSSHSTSIPNSEMLPPILYNYSPHPALRSPTSIAL
jgi:hypothetical protein